MKVLHIFAHPRLEKSKINRFLLTQIPDHAELTFVDLYEWYPDFNIDVAHQQTLLLQHDVIIWQHPFYWYSCPPLLKQWIDMVLEFNWAYGPKGRMLEGKKVLTMISTGGTEEAYGPDGHNRFTFNEYLRPFEQTVRLCKMTYLPPFILSGTHRLTDEQLLQKGAEYQWLVEQLVNQSPDFDAWQKEATSNLWIQKQAINHAQ